MAVEDTKGKKRKGALDSAPKAKKPRKSDDIAAAPKPAKAPKATPVAATPKAVKSKAKRKEAADFFSDDEAPAVESAQDEPKATKGKKKVKDSAKTNGNAPEPALADADALNTQNKLKKQLMKGKVADIEETLVTEAPVADAPKVKARKSKKEKQAETAKVEELAVVEAQVEAPGKKSKKGKGSKKQPEPMDEVVEAAADPGEVDGEVEEDDQTAALLAGFESDEEEEKDPEDDQDFDGDAVVPAITKKQRTALEKALKGVKSNEPGVIYIGRVPRGFFEPEMKKYFSQFGKVNRVRLSRNKKTGASKHYAFVEFQSTEVADIVARTMDNYLLFGHILKCKLIPAEQVYPDLFKGAGQRFKIDPRNKKAGLQMERGVERAQWEKRVENENKRRSGQNKHLKEEFGYEYSVPEVKAVDTVPKQLENGQPQQQLTDAPAEETAVEEQPKLKKGRKAAKASNETQPVEDDQPAAEKKGKKGAKGKVATELDVQAEIAKDVAAPTPERTGKKEKKRKSDVAPDTITVVEKVMVTEAAPKSKKARKGSNPPPVAEDAAEKKRKAKPEQDIAKPKKAKKAKA